MGVGGVWSGVESPMTKIPCDGCETLWESGDLAFVLDYGHECRYCPPCAEVYEGWRTLSTIEEARVQRGFDLWQLDRRRQVPLKRMPMDFPPVKRASGPPMVLG